MVRRSTFIVLACFVILVGFAWILQHFQSKKIEETATATSTQAKPNLYNLSDRQVNEIMISDSFGNQIGFYLDPISGQWAIAGLPSEQVDSYQIESIATQLINVQAEETLTQPPPLESLGLNSPIYTILMTTSDGGQLLTNIGSITPIGSGYYVMVGSNKVVIIDKIVMDEIISLLTNPPLLPTPTDQVGSVETISPTDITSLGTPTP